MAILNEEIFFIISIFLLLSFNINLLIVNAQTEPITASEGFYPITELKLMPNMVYNVQNITQSEVFMLIFDGNKKIQLTIRFEANSVKYATKPMKADYRIVIVGQDSKLSFTLGTMPTTTN